MGGVLRYLGDLKTQLSICIKHTGPSVPALRTAGSKKTPHRVGGPPDALGGVLEAFGEPKTQLSFCKKQTGPWQMGNGWRPHHS